jgi:hypothetical protein
MPIWMVPPSRTSMLEASAIAWSAVEMGRFGGLA